MVYNLSAINSTNILTLTQGVNSVLMNDFYGVLLVVTIFAMLFMSFQNRTQENLRSFAYAAMIAALLSLPLRALSLIGDLPVFFIWLLATIGVFSMFVTE